MKKLALSLVALMVAGAGVSVSSVGCSSSSSTGATADSGTGSDVTTGDDSSSDTGSPGTDTGTTPTDSGTGTETAPACDVDAAGSISVITQTADGGEVENTACEACISANCAQQQCSCLTDTNPGMIGDAAAPECAVYAICVYETFLTLEATTDAGAAVNLPAAQMTCATQTSAPMASADLGNLLISCIATACATQCVQ